MLSSSMLRLAGIKASDNYLAPSHAHQFAHAFSLIYSMLDTFPSLPAARCPGFTGALTPLLQANGGHSGREQGASDLRQDVRCVYLG